MAVYETFVYCIDHDKKLALVGWNDNDGNPHQRRVAGDEFAKFIQALDSPGDAINMLLEELE